MLEVLETYLNQLYANPIALGIFGSTIAGVILYVCKDIPIRISYFLLDMFTTNVTIYQDNNYTAYDSVEHLLNDSKLYYITGRFQLIYKWIHKKLEFACDEHAIYLARINGIWAFVTKSTDSQVQFFRCFTYSIRFLTRNKEKIETFLKNNYRYQISLADSEEYKVHQFVNNDWVYFFKKKIDMNMFISDKKNIVFKKISYFLNNEIEYINRNKPYREGIIFYGAPGCGKSFFIMQLASMFDLNIYYLNLNEFDSDANFIKAILSINQPSILLIEDIDCTTNLKPRDTSTNSINDLKGTTKKIETAIKDKKTHEVKNGISMSTILNVFDGILSQDGQITIITTNHIEKLDPALIRAGRFDTKIEFIKLNYIEICEFIHKWYRYTGKLSINENISLSIATLSQICASSNTIEDCISRIQSPVNI